MDLSTSEDISATRGATAAAPPNLLMLKTCVIQFNMTFQLKYSITLLYFLVLIISNKHNTDFYFIFKFCN